MKNRTVLITGATSGIGFETARQLSRMGATVVGIGRNPKKIASAHRQILEESCNSATHFLTADLTSQLEIRQVASRFKARHDHLDVLINNVGGMFLKREETVDGYEATWALNHLCQFLLTEQLMDILREQPRARIINVSSSSHYGAQIELDDPGMKRGYCARKAYRQSKLASVLFTYELARRLRGTGITANVLHPGLVRSEFFNGNGLLLRLFGMFLNVAALSTEEGAKTSIFLASSPETQDITGKFFINEKDVPSDPASYDEQLALRLWNLSEAQTGVVSLARPVKTRHLDHE